MQCIIEEVGCETQDKSSSTCFCVDFVKTLRAAYRHGWCSPSMQATGVHYILWCVRVAHTICAFISVSWKRFEKLTISGLRLLVSYGVSPFLRCCMCVKEEQLVFRDKEIAAPAVDIMFHKPYIVFEKMPNEARNCCVYVCVRVCACACVCVHA